MIVVREILTHIKITWLQEIFGNELLYPVSLRDCPGLERGIFCISIVDTILRRDLVVFSLLRARNYYCNKGPVCYILPFYSHYCYSELSILYLFILTWDTPVKVYSLLFSIDLRVLCYCSYVLLLTTTEPCFSHKYLICFFLVFLSTTILQQKKKSTTFDFWSSTTMFPVTQTKKALKYGSLSGLKQSWWGISWIRYKSPGFTHVSSVRSCIRSVIEISSDLSMVSSIFWLLISFRRAP